MNFSAPSSEHVTSTCASGSAADASGGVVHETATNAACAAAALGPPIATGQVPVAPAEASDGPVRTTGRIVTWPRAAICTMRSVCPGSDEVTRSWPPSTFACTSATWAAASRSVRTCAARATSAELARPPAGAAIENLTVVWGGADAAPRTWATKTPAPTRTTSDATTVAMTSPARPLPRTGAWPAGAPNAGGTDDGAAGAALGPGVTSTTGEPHAGQNITPVGSPAPHRPQNAATRHPLRGRTCPRSLAWRAARDGCSAERTV